ncbi:MAG: lactate utilization protein [Patescibacteria group bacterium]
MTYTTLADQATIKRTLTALEGRNIHTKHVKTAAEALEAIKSLIPAGASIMSGGSTTLEQIGYIEILKNNDHPWKNLKNEILAETDPAEQNKLRAQSSLADFFLGSVHAVTENGELLIASATGSQLGPYAFTSPNVIWIVGAQKIVPNLEAAFSRVREHVFPLEDARMKATGAPGSVFGKWLIFEREVMPRNLHLILVDEVLGF